MKHFFFPLLVVLSIVLPPGPSTTTASFEAEPGTGGLRAAIEVDSFQLTPGKGGVVGIDVRGVLGDEPFTLKGDAGSLINAFDPQLKWTVDVVLEALGIELKIEGSIMDAGKFRGVDLNFAMAGRGVSGLEKFLKTTIPIPGPFDLKGNVKVLGTGTYQLSEIILRYGDSDLKGSCKIDLSRDRPDIAAYFSSSQLDLRSLSRMNNVPESESVEPSPKPATTDKDPAKRKRVFSTEPLDLDFLDSANLTFELVAEKVVFPRSAFSDFHIKAVMTDGGLKIGPLKGRIGGGGIDGSLSMEPEGNGHSISAFLNIEQMSLANLFQEMELSVMGEGTVDLNLDLNARGMSVAEIMAGLDGEASLAMGKGRIDKNYLKYLGIFRIDLISTLIRIVDIPVGKEKQKTAGEVNCFAMRIDAKDGNADLTALVLDRPSVCIVGSGRIDLVGEGLDLYIKPISKEGLGAKGLAKVNLSLSELTKAFRLGGTLARPRVSVDTTKTFLTLGKALGGAVLFGPAGLAVALFSGKIGSHPENPCLDALEAAKKGVDIDDDGSGALKSIENFLKELSPIN